MILSILKGVSVVKIILIIYYLNQYYAAIILFLIKYISVFYTGA